LIVYKVYENVTKEIGTKMIPSYEISVGKRGRREREREGKERVSENGERKISGRL